MFKPVFVFMLLTVTLTSAAASPLLVTLPDNGVYYYWVRGAGGSIVHAPRTSTGVGQIELKEHSFTGTTLYILDSHTGEVAQIPLADNSKPVLVNIDQFQLPAAASTVPVSSTASPVNQPSTPAPPSESGSSQPAPSLLSRVVTFLFGLLVFAGVIWFVRLLILTRGQALIDAARKVGVDVPNPDDLPKTTIRDDGTYEPPPVIKVQRVPDEAFKPAVQQSVAGYLTTQDGTAYTVGAKPLSIGRDSDNDIVLPDTSVSRRHARVEQNAGRLEIHDEGSANGVFVNGERVDSRILSPGDYLHIGRVPMRYEA